MNIWEMVESDAVCVYSFSLGRATLLSGCNVVCGHNSHFV